jgi:hypothetical protein
MAGNIMDPIHTRRPRTPSPSSQRTREAQQPHYEFPMTENGRKLLQKYFGSSM